MSGHTIEEPIAVQDVSNEDVQLLSFIKQIEELIVPAVLAEFQKTVTNADIITFAEVFYAKIKHLSEEKFDKWVDARMADTPWIRMKYPSSVLNMVMAMIRIYYGGEIEIILTGTGWNGRSRRS